MSSVAVLTPESFAEHLSGIKDQEMTGGVPEDEAYIPTYLEAFPPLPENKGAPGDKSGEPAGPWGSKIRPIKASVITQVFNVPLEERRYKDNSQFGDGGEEAKVCLDIMQRTGAHIELSLAKDQGLSIMVTGKLDSVMKARKEIVSRLQTQASATVAIPKEHHRFVIGKNGEKLQELELKTATKIAIPRPDDPSLNIRITGTKEGIEKARHEILLISAEQDKRAVERLSLEKVFHPFIAGAYNRLVQELCQETGARVSIPPPSLHKDEIVITGEKESVALAISRIRAIYDEKKRKTTTISVEVKKSQHKYIVGPKGNSLHEIMETTGVSVEMPPLDSCSETIILRGEPDKLGPALTQVYAKAKSVMVVEVTAPAWLHRFIIGKKGQNIGRITQQLPKVHIEFTDGEERISLEGPTEEVEQAQVQIQDMIRDLLVRMDYTDVNIDQRFHRHLIGKNGANSEYTHTHQYKVSVWIPQEPDRSGLVRIEGDPKGVQLARRELMEMAQRMENERTKDLIVEQKFHRAIIGQKGEKIKEVRDKFPEVMINFPDPAQKSDIVQLRGPKNEVEKCAKFLAKLIADLMENSFSLSIPIFKQFHKNIIGKGGANIKKIREETTTKIDLPTENSNSEMIVITGRKNHCEAARDRILAIQRELEEVEEKWQGECGRIGFTFLVNNFTAELQAKPEYHKFLIGKGGVNIRGVRDRTGARIIFPSPDEPEQELITIIGREEAVRLAQKELETLVKNLDDVVEDSMVVETRHHRYFVCRRGQVLRELAEEYGGVAVSFPRTGTHSDRITLKGAKDCVEAAKRRIQEIIEDLEAQVSVEVAVPQRYHRAVMGPKGVRIQQITRDYEVQVKFPERDDNNTEPPQENGDASPEAEFVLRKCDVITISGRTEKCELAKIALLALVPVTEDVEVSFELHRYIIGQKGSGIRKMMEEYEVNIWVPQPEQQSDVIKVTGQVANVERAKSGLLERVKELQAEQEDRALRSFKVSISVDPKFHPKIIGRKGAVISQIRKDHDVNVQFPDKGDELQDVIVISGYERNTEEARSAIELLVSTLQEMVSHDVHLDPRTHARIIGARGKAVRKTMEEFKVDIRFPQPGSEDPGRVTVTGLPESVDNAVDHLLNLEEEYVSDGRETIISIWSKHDKLCSDVVCCCVSQAPDMSNAEDFPTFGAGLAPKQTSAWGPKKF
uniref:High density lipoprotein-binding protein n=1 Tax=Oncorhynchus kisutch TaxID=8019 RepID=A0A8C7FTN8_ONCKI